MNSYDSSPITLQQHILGEQQRFPHATGEFSWLLSGITLATKRIQAMVRRAGLTDILGIGGEINVHGETQQRLDVFANQALVNSLRVRDNVAILVSEENDQPIWLKPPRGGYNSNTKYAVIFDPLDGSSNIDVNVSVGTIFSVVRLPDDLDINSEETECLLQPGTQQVAAGYVTYGSSTILVYTAGNGVHGFTLDPAVGAYMLSHENLKMPAQGPYFSANEGHRDEFSPPYREYLEFLRSGQLGQPYGARYIGSLVADFHRTLLKGGVFLYPPNRRDKVGKLRLLYEANPIAMLTEQAGGIAIDGVQRIMDIKPTDLHQRVGLVLGGRREMEAFEPYRKRLAEIAMSPTLV